MYFGFVHKLDMTESMIFLEDISRILCQVTKPPNMENRWEESLQFTEVLLYAGY